MDTDDVGNDIPLKGPEVLFRLVKGQLGVESVPLLLFARFPLSTDIFYLLVSDGAAVDGSRTLGALSEGQELLRVIEWEAMRPSPTAMRLVNGLIELARW